MGVCQLERAVCNSTVLLHTNLGRYWMYNSKMPRPSSLKPQTLPTTQAIISTSSKAAEIPAKTAPFLSPPFDSTCWKTPHKPFQGSSPFLMQCFPHYLSLSLSSSNPSHLIGQHLPRPSLSNRCAPSQDMPHVGFHGCLLNGPPLVQGPFSCRDQGFYSCLGNEAKFSHKKPGCATAQVLARVCYRGTIESGHHICCHTVAPRDF